MHAAPERGLFTGNRGRLVDDRAIVRHHRGSLWISVAPSSATGNIPSMRRTDGRPLFFLDDAVALAAGHRPCALCRRDDYLAIDRQ